MVVRNRPAIARAEWCCAKKRNSIFRCKIQFSRGIAPILRLFAARRAHWWLQNTAGGKLRSGVPGRGRVLLPWSFCPRSIAAGARVFWGFVGACGARRSRSRWSVTSSNRRCAGGPHFWRQLPCVLRAGCSEPALNSRLCATQRATKRGGFCAPRCATCAAMTLAETLRRRASAGVAAGVTGPSFGASTRLPKSGRKGL
mgnify:CR=1 FL=1